MFRKSFGGQKWSFSKKFGGPLGYHLASSEVSKTRWKNIKNMFFSKKKLVQNDVKWPPDEFPLIRKFIALFSSRFMHFLIFSYFSFFPLSQALHIPFGPLVLLNFVHQPYVGWRVKYGVGPKGVGNGRSMDD